MTDLTALYAAAGGDAADVLRRLGSEELVRRFALRFASDGSFAALQSALRAGDLPAAFRAAHTLRGIAENLGFADLAAAASALTELLRAGNTPTPEAVRAVETAHARLLRALRE